MKPIQKFITFIVLVGLYIFMPYPVVRFLFYITMVLLFIKVTDIGMQMKDGFDEVYEAYVKLSSKLKGDTE